MSIPALLWRDYSDGITRWQCLACNQDVHFWRPGADGAVIGVHVGRLCTWCGVAWTSVIQEEQATQRARAPWRYELYRREDRASLAIWQIMRRPDRACDYHDDDGLPLEDRPFDSAVQSGPAKEGLSLLRVCRRQALERACTCHYYATRRQIPD